MLQGQRAEPAPLSVEQLRAREAAENFSVAPRLLPGALRRDLRAIYDVARTIDQLGDDGSGGTPEQRLAALDDFDADLARVWDEPPRPSHPALTRLIPTVRAHHLPAAPFHALVEANRMDQRVSAYPTWEALRGYCSLSAAPVGRLVLDICHASTEERVRWSDDICTALQLLEHCQDVAEDRRAGRVYLPLTTLSAAGCPVTDLDARATGGALRAAVALETERAEALLRSAGPPLVRSLSVLPRLLIAGFVAGGLATAAALRRAEFDVLRVTPHPRRRDTVGFTLRLLAGRVSPS